MMDSCLKTHFRNKLAHKRIESPVFHKITQEHLQISKNDFQKSTPKGLKFGYVVQIMIINNFCQATISKIESNTSNFEKFSRTPLKIFEALCEKISKSKLKFLMEIDVERWRMARKHN